MTIARNSAQLLTYSLTAPTKPNGALLSVLSQVQANSDYWAANTPKSQSRALGQVFSPLAMSVHLSSLLPDESIPDKECKLADPGAGTGILSVAMAARIAGSNKTPKLTVHGFEIDNRLKASWDQAWEMFELRGELSVDAKLDNDFTRDADRLLKTGNMEGMSKPRIIHTNPPYHKLNKSSALSKVMSANGIPVTNLYAAFVALSVSWLQEDGELYAILPRSFASGDHFKKFRLWLAERMSVEHVVLYRSRSCFKNVLQETILVRMKKMKCQSEDVRITVLDTPDSLPEYDLVMPAEQLITDDGWWMPRSRSDIALVNMNRNREHSLESLGINVSTGKVEMHRLSGQAEVTVFYSKDFNQHGEITWGETGKPRTVMMEPKQILDLPEAGCYVGLKRISSNDGINPQRLFPVIISRQTTGQERIGIENHVQYLHIEGKPMTQAQAEQLVEALKSDELNAVLRSIGGTTQVNKADLAKLRF